MQNKKDIFKTVMDASPFRKLQIKKLPYEVVNRPKLTKEEIVKRYTDRTKNGILPGSVPFASFPILTRSQVKGCEPGTLKKPKCVVRKIRWGKLSKTDL